MHKDSSTSYLDELRNEFLSDPVHTRVVLPDGSLAVVRCVLEVDEGRVYRVQGVHPNGRFRALESISCWFRADELRLFYYTASIREVAS
jgi:hypothetical protein